MALEWAAVATNLLALERALPANDFRDYHDSASRLVPFNFTIVGGRNGFLLGVTRCIIGVITGFNGVVSVLAQLTDETGRG